MQMLFMFLFITCSRVYSQVSQVHYVSDGVPLLYKNFKNLANLVHHQDDNQLGAECHYFAKSYGKSPCDGIGGTVKHLTTQSCFQNNHIFNVDLIYDLCVNNIPGIIFIKTKTDMFKIVTQNFLWKKNIHLLIVFKAQEFTIILLLKIMALKWE